MRGRAKPVNLRALVRYRAYGLGRGELRSIFSPGTVWTYLKLLARGRRYQGRSSDYRQLGGDFVIDAAGKVRYEHRSVNPSDRPSPERLLEVLGRI